MDERIKKLMGFIVEKEPQILVSPCEFLDEISQLKGYGTVKCTHEKCDNYKNCIKMNMKVPFLPLHSFHAWVVDPERFKLSEGYIFFLAFRTLKDFGILAINGKEYDDIALSYGFQLLYSDKWHYYLKSTSREKFIALEE